MVNKYTLFFFTCIFLITPGAQACTTFCTNSAGQTIVGTNFDFIEGPGYIFTNKRGVSKSGLSNSEKKLLPVQWTSQYGSITFNWWGLEFPYTGINEEGLVISGLGLRQTEYPPYDSQPVIFAAQWTQYCLDSFGTVKEVIKNISKISIISPIGTLGKLHYFICDKTGDCAVIEYLNGKLVCYTQENLPIKALTNTDYAKSIDCLKTGDIPVPDHISSIDRFIRTAKFLQDQKSKDKDFNIDFAFDTLALTHLGEITEVEGQKIRSYIATEWSIVYDVENLKVYYKTFYNHQVRHFNLSSFDFSCKTPIRALDIQQDITGDASGFFIDYNMKLNKAFFDKFQSIIPKINRAHGKTLNRLTDYPETTFCTQ